MEIVKVPDSGRVIVRAGRVFDGRALLPEKNVDILVDGGLIREVRPYSPEVPPFYGEDARVLDLRQCAVLPGLVDAHVHLALDGKDFKASLELWSRRELLEKRIEEDLAGTLSRGIVAVRDGGDLEGIGLSFRDRTARGATPGPRILATGIALGKKGHYGSFLGPGLEGNEIGEAVDALARRGVDQVKVLASGVASFKTYRRVGPVQFTKGEMKEIVDRSHGCGMKVMAHASSDEAVRLSVRAGVDSVEHGYFVSRETLEEMAGAGTAWMPTLAAVAMRAKEPLSERYSPQEREVITRTYRRHQGMVRLGADLGVRIGLGTDAGSAGVMHGEGLLDEALLLEEAGLSPDRVLRAATATGAFVLGLEREMGEIRPGRRPYLIAVRGNPAGDLADLKNIELIILPSGG